MTMSNDSLKYCLHLDGNPLDIIFLTMEAAKDGAARFASTGTVEILASTACRRGCVHGWRYPLLNKNRRAIEISKAASSHAPAEAADTGLALFRSCGP